METYTIHLTSLYTSFFKCIRKMLTSCPRLPTFFGLHNKQHFCHTNHESRLTRGRRNEDKDPREEEVEGQSHQHRPHPVPPYDEAGRAQRSTPEKADPMQRIASPRTPTKWTTAQRLRQDRARRTCATDLMKA